MLILHRNFNNRYLTANLSRFCVFNNICVLLVTSLYASSNRPVIDDTDVGCNRQEIIWHPSIVNEWGYISTIFFEVRPAHHFPRVVCDHWTSMLLDHHQETTVWQLILSRLLFLTSGDQSAKVAKTNLERQLSRSISAVRSRHKGSFTAWICNFASSLGFQEPTQRCASHLEYHDCLSPLFQSCKPT